MGFQNVDDPALKLYRGMTYDFNLNVGTHTFFITTEPKAGDYEGVSGVALTEDSGVYNNGIRNGILRFTVPQNAPSVYGITVRISSNGQIQVKQFHTIKHQQLVLTHPETLVILSLIQIIFTLLYLAALHHLDICGKEQHYCMVIYGN